MRMARQQAGQVANPSAGGGADTGARSAQPRGASHRPQAGRSVHGARPDSRSAAPGPGTAGGVFRAEEAPALPRLDDPRGFGRVAVLAGGSSAEREISLRTGRAALEALRARGVASEPVDPAIDGLDAVLGRGWDRAFVALHGRGGEDGVIQGALEAAGIPYTGSGVLGSALAMDKVRAKRVWQGEALPTPQFRVVTDAAGVERVLRELEPPFMVKPAREGSSIGMARVEDPDALAAACEAARAHDREVIVERWVEGEEYTAAILGNEVLPLIRLETPRAFYDYEAKYAEGAGTRYHCPCGLDRPRERALQQLAWRAFRALGCEGWGRVDLMVDRDGLPWLLEVNTVPGLTDHSLVPMAARAVGMDLEALVWRILESSLARERGRREAAG